MKERTANSGIGTTYSDNPNKNQFFREKTQYSTTNNKLRSFNDIQVQAKAKL